MCVCVCAFFVMRGGGRDARAGGQESKKFNKTKTTIERDKSRHEKQAGGLGKQKKKRAAFGGTHVNLTSEPLSCLM